MEVATYLEERVWVGLTMQLGSSVVHATVEMMFPMRGDLGYLQPFRFASFGAQERQVLEREIAELLKEARAAHWSGLRLPRVYRETF